MDSFHPGRRDRSGCYKGRRREARCVPDATRGSSTETPRLGFAMVGKTRTVGMNGKPLKSALHHWWPRGLSELWKDKDGSVTRIAWDGKTLRAPPKQFGAITNG